MLLVARKSQLETIRSVALDESSRTSATLVKIIFREFLGRDAEWTTCSPNLNEMLDRNDAALIIGDPAMVFTRGDLKIWDMASLWRNYTGLGFVFAMWMVRNESIDVDFAGARDEGVTRIDEIVDAYKDKIPMDLKRYLTENIVYRIDESMQRGLELYFQLAHKHHLIERVKPLRYI